jgi:16S rRNA (guanine(527)-N(7))-methyltransferase RsmG
LDQLEQHYELMLKWNKVVNLTRIERVEDAVDRHYAESLFLGSKLPIGFITVADLGSGAGFPGIPIAVLRPDARITLIESHKRKAVFLREACRGLPNVSVQSKRAEDIGESFDWVVCRAVKWEEIETVAFRLAPCVGFLGATAPDDCAVRRIPLPWDEHRGITIVSRETTTVGST